MKPATASLRFILTETIALVVLKFSYECKHDGKVIAIMTTTTTTTTTTSTPVVRTGVYPHMPIAVIASFGQFVTRSRSCAASLSHLANDRPMHYRFSFWPWELTPGPNFTKLGGGLQQTPLPHPAKFQPDRANALRDVRYQCFHFLTSWGVNPWVKVHQKGR